MHRWVLPASLSMREMSGLQRGCCKIHPESGPSLPRDGRRRALSCQVPLESGTSLHQNGWRRPTAKCTHNPACRPWAPAQTGRSHGAGPREDTQTHTHTHAQQQGFPPARAGADNGSGDNSCPTAVDPAPADRVPGRETLPGHDTHNSNGWVLLLELTTAAAAAVQRRSAVLPTHPSPSPRHVSRSAPAERRRATVAHGKHTAARAGLLLELATAAAGARRGPAIALR